MRIALIAPTAIPARRANTVQVMKMAQALAINGHEVCLLSPQEKAGQEPVPWERLANHYGLHKEFQIEWLSTRPNFRRYDYGWSAVKWADEWGCDLVYTRLMQAAALASLKGMPTILEMHDLPAGRIGPRVFKLFLRGRGAQRLAVITHILANDLTRIYGTPVPGNPADAAFTIIAPDGVDLERYSQHTGARLPNPEESRRMLLEVPIDPDRFTAGYTGHLYPGRGTALLLELASRVPQIQFLLVGGEADDVERLQAQVNERRLENIYLTGFVANAALPLYQAACDVLLMPYEQKVSASSGGDIGRYLSPMKVFEYMASERPILSSDLPPLREVLSPDNAILLPVGQIEAWISALNDLQSDPQRGTILASQARVDVTNYTWEARAVNLLQGLSLKDLS